MHLEAWQSGPPSDGSSRNDPLRATLDPTIFNPRGLPSINRINHDCVWALAALWLGLALVASLLSIWFRISTALSEIVVGTIAQLIIGAVDRVGRAWARTNRGSSFSPASAQSS